jgi:hypothetical protein
LTLPSPHLEFGLWHLTFVHVQPIVFLSVFQGKRGPTFDLGLHQTELTYHFFKDFKKLRLIHTRFAIEKISLLCYFESIVNSGGKIL